MTDDLDVMLQGENQDSPSGSQTENASTGSNSDIPADDGQGTEGEEEKVTFDKLTGSAQDRFRKIYQDRQNKIAEAEKWKQLAMQNQPVQQQTTNGQPNPEVQDAIQKLDSAGIATKEFVQKQVQDILAQKTYYDELSKLEGQINGSDGRPAFTREEYFDYVDRHPQYKNYLPIDVYAKMYPEELRDWQETHKSETQVRKSSALRPTRTASRENEELTVDEIEAKLKSLPEPQRSEWYLANQAKINRATQKMATG